LIREPRIALDPGFQRLALVRLQGIEHVAEQIGLK